MEETSIISNFLPEFQLELFPLKYKVELLQQLMKELDLKNLSTTNISFRGMQQAGEQGLSTVFTLHKNKIQVLYTNDLVDDYNYTITPEQVKEIVSLDVFRCYFEETFNILWVKYTNLYEQAFKIYADEKIKNHPVWPKCERCGQYFQCKTALTRLYDCLDDEKQHPLSMLDLPEEIRKVKNKENLDYYYNFRKHNLKKKQFKTK